MSNLRKQIIYIFLGAFVLFVLNKFVFRPYILAGDFPSVIRHLVLSFPNFAEAVMGMLVVTGILFRAKQYRNKIFKKIESGKVYLVAALFTALYTLSQELRFHNLGGNNIYDPYDLVASILGIVTIYLYLNRTGFVNSVPEEN